MRHSLTKRPDTLTELPEGSLAFANTYPSALCRGPKSRPAAARASQKAATSGTVKTSFTAAWPCRALLAAGCNSRMAPCDFWAQFYDPVVLLITSEVIEMITVESSHVIYSLGVEDQTGEHGCHCKDLGQMERIRAARDARGPIEWFQEGDRLDRCPLRSSARQGLPQQATSKAVPTPRSNTFLDTGSPPLPIC